MCFLISCSARMVLLSQGLRPPGPPVLNFSEWALKDMIQILILEVFTIFGPENPEVFTIFGFENRGSAHYFRIWEPWKCSLFSDLKTVEVFTIFGSENRGSVHYFRIWKPWKCSLFSDLRTLEVFTIFESANPGSAHYFRIWKPWKC